MLSTSQLSPASTPITAGESSSTSTDRGLVHPLFDASTQFHKLGSGSFGTVYHGNGLDGKQYALKVARSDHRAINLLAAEAKALADVGEHPNIVRSFGMMDTPLGRSLVLEHVPGNTLSRLLDKMQFSIGKFAPENEAHVAMYLHLAHQLLSGLDHIHQKNVQHCDINPNNLMITHDGVLKIIDLGLARESQKRLEGTFGSVGYMPPEMFYSKQRNSGIKQDKIDTYSAAMVMFRLFTGLEVNQSFDQVVPPSTDIYHHYPMHKNSIARENNNTYNPIVHYPMDTNDVRNNIRTRTNVLEAESSFQKWSEAIVTPRLRAELEITDGRGGVWPEKPASRTAQILSDYKQQILQSQLISPDPRAGRADTHDLLSLSQSLYDKISPLLIEEGVRVLRAIQDTPLEHPTDARDSRFRPDTALGEHTHSPNFTKVPELKLLREQLKQPQPAHQTESEGSGMSSSSTLPPLLERRRVHWEASLAQRSTPMGNAFRAMGQWFQNLGNSVKGPT